ncbi:hypothetical protein Tco_1068513 [Tanacetum coccineum]|uniref:Uncharacterized protein n=1 Tax=Tanacetum coccineum TaxID=301880 RepID=A0ABQ5HG45_9ASTR
MIMKTLLRRFVKVRSNRATEDEDGDQGAPSHSDVRPPNRSSIYQVHHQANMYETSETEYELALSLAAVRPPTHSHSSGDQDITTRVVALDLDIDNKPVLSK